MLKNLLLIIGLALILISLKPIISIAQETSAKNHTLSRYALEQVIDIKHQFSETMNQHQLDKPITALGNVIEVITEPTNIPTPTNYFYKESSFFTKVIIKINGKETASPSMVQFEQDDNDTDSRFLSWLNIMKVTDHKTGLQKVAIVQKLSGIWVEGEDHDEFLGKQTWRVLYVGEDKQISTEQFTYSERGKHQLGTYLVIVSNQSSTFMGFTNDSLAYLPSILYPFIYPVVTTFIGIISTLLGILLHRKKIINNMQ